MTPKRKNRPLLSGRFFPKILIFHHAVESLDHLSVTQHNPPRSSFEVMSAGEHLNRWTCTNRQNLTTAYLKAHTYEVCVRDRFGNRFLHLPSQISGKPKWISLTPTPLTMG